jgi:hypothetical protein
MVQYTCFRCGYFSKQKSDMRSHLNRKNVCDPILRDINLDEYSKDILGRRKFIETAENIESAPFGSISAPFGSISAPFGSISCEYCKRSYKYGRNLSKHLKTCKLKIIADEEESELNVLNEQIDTYKSKINQLESARKPNRVINNNNNTQNNTDNTQNNNTININIAPVRLPYSETNYNVVSSENMVRIVGSSLRCIQNIVKATHFNKDHPENHNIFISSLKSGVVTVYNGNTWDAHIWSTFSEQLVSDNITTISDWMELNGKKYPRLVPKFANFTNRQDDDKFNRALHNELKLMFYNNRTIILPGLKKLNNLHTNNVQPVQLEIEA